MTDHQRWPAAPGCDQGVLMQIGHAGLWRFNWEDGDQEGTSYLFDTVTALYSGGQVGLQILDGAPVSDAVWWWPSATPPKATDIGTAFEFIPEDSLVRAEAIYEPTGRRYVTYGPDRPAAGIELLASMYALDAIGRLRPKVEVVQ